MPSVLAEPPRPARRNKTSQSGAKKKRKEKEKRKGASARTTKLRVARPPAAAGHGSGWYFSKKAAYLTFTAVMPFLESSLTREG